MNITIESPSGPRRAVLPFQGITDEFSLIKSLALTLSVECQRGVEEVTLSIDISSAVSERLIAVARVFSQMQTDAQTQPKADFSTKTVQIPEINNFSEAHQAMQLLNALEAHIEAGNAPLHGYKAAAELINWEMNFYLPVAQICSRLDLAAFNAELPMLALNWVRTPSGLINRKAFPPQWAELQETFVKQMMAHKWTHEHFALLRKQLEDLPPDDAAMKLWGQCATKLNRIGFNRRWTDLTSTSVEI